MHLKQSGVILPPAEPMGIVIANGGLRDQPTRFAAFVWGPVPDDDLAVPSRTKALATAC